MDNTDSERQSLEVSLKKLQDRARNIRKKMDITDGRVQVWGLDRRAMCARVNAGVM